MWGLGSRTRSSRSASSILDRSSPVDVGAILRQLRRWRPRGGGHLPGGERSGPRRSRPSDRAGARYAGARRSGFDRTAPCRRGRVAGTRAYAIRPLTSVRLAAAARARSCTVAGSVTRSKLQPSPAPHRPPSRIGARPGCRPPWRRPSTWWNALDHLRLLAVEPEAVAPPGQRDREVGRADVEAVEPGVRAMASRLRKPSAVSIIAKPIIADIGRAVVGRVHGEGRPRRPIGAGAVRRASAGKKTTRPACSGVSIIGAITPMQPESKRLHHRRGVETGHAVERHEPLARIAAACRPSPGCRSNRAVLEVDS